MSRRFYLPSHTSKKAPKGAPPPRRTLVYVFGGGLALILAVAFLLSYTRDDRRFEQKPAAGAAPKVAVTSSLPETTPSANPPGDPVQTPVMDSVSNEQADALTEFDETTPEFPIRLQVLNGCGIKGITRQVTPALRSKGFDVRETRNAKTFDYLQTLVIDRAGNPALAGIVADSLGIDRSRVTSERSEYLVDIDVTVVIGQDYKSLKLNL